MKKLTRFISIITMIAILSSILIGCESKNASGDQSSDPNAKPKVILIGAHELGTGAHRELSLVAEGIDNYYDDIAVRITPSGTATSRLYLARNGDAFATTLDQPDYYAVNEGNYAFSEADWGPQPIRSVFLSGHLGAVLGTRGDSGIESFEDLKGKKFPYLPAQPGINTMNEAFLAFGGLTWDDVDVVEYATSTAMYDAVVRGDLPASFFNITASAAFEGVEHPDGWKWIDMPESNTEAWDRVKSVFPFQPKKITYGAGVSEDNPAMGMTYAFPALIAYDDLDENKAYWVTRSIIEARDSYKDTDAVFKTNWNSEQFMKIFETDFIPMHDGSIRYMKEIGLWTDEHDKINQQRIEYQEKLRALWDEAMEERNNKGIEDSEFNEYWMNKKTEAGLGLQYFYGK